MKKNLQEQSLQLHKENHGKMEIKSKVPLRDAQDLSLVYTPGVAEPCRVIHESEEQAYEYTIKGNLVAVVSNGTAVLGLGNIGASAAMPVMEGKALLFKTFADIDAFPICLNVTDVEQFVAVVKAMEPTFGGINLEDISAPQCFEIEARLKQEMGIPVFHDDQHGTAVVTVAALLNAVKVVNKPLASLKVVVNGAGSAGIAVVKLLHHLGVRNLVLCDTKGAIYRGRSEGMNPIKAEMAELTNPHRIEGSLSDVIKGMDAFIGVSAANSVTPEMVRSMDADPIIFAMANPDPEISPEAAIQAGAKVIGTGRSDYPNQVNNVLAFPGIFRGALDVRASDINEEMKIAAAEAIASLVSEAELREGVVIPNPFNPDVATSVAKAVAAAAVATGVARR